MKQYLKVTQRIFVILSLPVPSLYEFVECQSENCINIHLITRILQKPYLAPPTFPIPSTFAVANHQAFSDSIDVPSLRILENYRELLGEPSRIYPLFSFMGDTVCHEKGRMGMADSRIQVNKCTRERRTCASAEGVGAKGG